MANNNLNFDEFHNFSKQQIEAATTVAGVVSKGFQDIAAEAADYSKHSWTAGTEAVERLLGAKTVESAVQIQTDYVKSAYEGFVARTTKINEIVAKVAAEAAKPVQNAFSAYSRS